MFKPYSMDYIREYYNKGYQKCHNKIYNYIVGSYTVLLYRDFLSKCDKNSTILDVGVGNGLSLCSNSDVIKERNLQILAIDIDNEAIIECASQIQKKNLCSNVFAKTIDLFALPIDSKKYDYIYFSNSYSVIPNSARYLSYCLQNLSKNKNNLYISQTIFDKSTLLTLWLKPRIKHFLFNIDFGREMTLQKLEEELALYDLSIKSQSLIHRRNCYGIPTANIFTFEIGHKLTSCILQNVIDHPFAETKKLTCDIGCNTEVCEPISMTTDTP